MGKIEETHPDIHGNVRTVTVLTRDRKKAVRERKDVCKAGLAMVELPVQRLVLILPPEEQPAELLQGLTGFPPMPGAKLRGDPQGGPEARQETQAAPPVRVERPEGIEEMVDLPRPQRVPRPRGRPRRAQ